MSLQKEFEALGCWSAPTEEEHISVYGLDFLPPAMMTAMLLCGAKN